MPARRSRLQLLLAALQRHQGGPIEPATRDPWHGILWENVAYLCNDDARARAFGELKRATALTAGLIADAPDPVLLAASKFGKLAGQRVQKLRQRAELFASVGDPRRLVELPLAKARPALRKFPGIGEPGADKLLLFAGNGAVLAYESNGLRALLRLGYGTEAKSYAQSYRSACAAAAVELPESTPLRLQAFLSLRRHGQELCRANPVCGNCPLFDDCPSHRSSAAK